MYHFKHKRLNSSGDTIIEVLIVLAVLSMAFAISSATASKGLVQSRNAQEHSQALGDLDSQVEQLRTAVNAQTDVFQNTVTPVFCMKDTTHMSAPFAAGYNTNVSAANDNFASYPADCRDSSGAYPYYKSIVYYCDLACKNAAGAGGYFDLRIRWDGQGTLGRQQEDMTYKIDALTPTGSSGIPLTGSPSQVQISEQDLDVTPTQNTPPACGGSTHQGNHSGISVNLNPGNIPGTINGGSYLFDHLTDNVTYSVVNGSVTNLPADFNICSISGAVTPRGTTEHIKVVLQPQCTTRWNPASSGPPETGFWSSSSSAWWWHTADQYPPYRDWGPNGFGMPGYVETGYTSWEQAIGISGANDYAANINGSIMGGQFGSGWTIDPSPWFGGTAATGANFYQDYDYGNGVPNNKKWYNFWEQVVTTVWTWNDTGPTNYPATPYSWCPS